ncbi:MAG: PAS domain S-box protein [Deltaproteobacteria bacterium]|nr:PAS domain S-box protein [Deltaproteobacteria bacterium]
MGKDPIDPEFRFRVTAEFTADWQFWVREDGAVEYISSECERISGFSRKDMLTGKVRLKDYIHPDDFAMMRAQYYDAIAGREKHNIEFRIRRRDGEMRWGAVSFIPVRDEFGRSYGFRGSIRDITDRKKAEEALRRERNLLDKVVSSIGAGLVLVDRSYRILWYNSIKTSCLGILEPDRGGCCYQVLVGRQAVCPGCPVEQAFATGRQARAEKTGITLPNGRVCDLLIIATPLVGPDGTFDQCLELILDITEKRAQQAERERLRRQLIHAQKMEAVGTLAGGIAHEFNNLLTGILGFTSLLQMQIPPEGPGGKSLTMIEKSARRAAELTRQLLGFARKGKCNVQAVGINDVVRSVLSIIRQTFDRVVTIEEDLFPDIWSVSGDPGQLEQVLLNLCINARDAMPAGGTLTIRTRNADAEDERPASLRNAVPGPCVLLSVKDTGTGIPPSIRDRIFEPFFTTKDPGKGTGMGLSVVYGIVQGHEGAIDVESRPDTGTTFHVCLPAGKSSPA